MYYRINYNEDTREVLVEGAEGNYPTAAGGDFDSIGTYKHDDDPETTDDPLAGMQGASENHVHYHHVQEALYKLDPSVQDMQRIAIYINRIRTMSIGSGTITMELEEDAVVTKQLTLTTVPAPANDHLNVIYESDDPGVVSVNASGLLTAHTVGSALITATAKWDDTITATRAVEVEDDE